MRRVQKPTEDAGEVFQTCIDIVRSTSLRARLSSIRPVIEAAADDYETSASSVMLHTLPTADHINGVTKDEMSDVYEFRMVRQGTPGRSIYDRLISAPIQGRCPLCGHGQVSTLDHYLPRSSFPALTVLPINLIPACGDCNKLKRDFLPSTQEELSLHPYYDEVEDDRWLYAEVVEEIPTALTYYVLAPTDWTAIKSARVSNHFYLFELGTLYASNAASELVEMRLSLERLYTNAGAAAVQDHLREQATSCSRAHINSWRTAMFDALADNEWFCSGGFR